MLARLDRAGLVATVAPELELFLVDRRELDGQVSLHAPASRDGAPARERACEAYSLERTGHFAEYFDALFAACHLQGIPVCGHAHEAAYSQYEVNFMPGEPLAQADAVFRFKRLARQVAAQFGFLATFAPKPFLDQPGTGMHWHFSLQHKDGALAETGRTPMRSRIPTAATRTRWARSSAACSATPTPRWRSSRRTTWPSTASA